MSSTKHWVRGDTRPLEPAHSCCQAFVRPCHFLPAAANVVALRRGEEIIITPHREFGLGGREAADGADTTPTTRLHRLNHDRCLGCIDLPRGVSGIGMRVIHGIDMSTHRILELLALAVLSPQLRLIRTLHLIHRAVSSSLSYSLAAVRSIRAVEEEPDAAQSHACAGGAPACVQPISTPSHAAPLPRHNGTAR